ncbi:riboflavin biosynthesis protein RibF [Halobacillus sp. A1]|uniref:riboflavin biosynthesis protein RibF n=1 Tax=Halobacillus sp. A1 TaxID=2880262 RepID=UPI0020A66A0C|nr:riboflavin biosynthesis protein RibF [Halobacillus sp. A1]MCP3031239.1 riboflavin biosynthesis protein RibF [Halobacillus sp. A1]
MRTFHLSSESPIVSEDLSASSLAVGFFDGIHKGHQQVIRTAVQQADKLGIDTAVMTFTPHPSVVLNKSVQHARYITPLPEKERILEDMGVDKLFVVHFDLALASLSPAEFAEKFFVDLNIHHVVAGFDFSFGYKGKGSMKELPSYAKGRFTTTTVAKVSQGDEKVSSTRIRGLLNQGDMAEIKTLLNRPYSIQGEVVESRTSRKAPGPPMIPIHMNEAYYLPTSGIYAVEVEFKGEIHKGMAVYSMSLLRSEQNEEGSLEVRTFDSEQDLYGEKVRIYFHEFIRPVIEYQNREQLMEQLQSDERECRRILTVL